MQFEEKVSELQDVHLIFLKPYLMQCVAFQFLNKHVGRCTHVHIPGWQYQDSLDPNCKIVLQWAREIILIYKLPTTEAWA